MTQLHECKKTTIRMSPVSYCVKSLAAIILSGIFLFIHHNQGILL